VFANDRTEQIFGYEEGELLGEPVDTLISLRFRDRHLRHRAHYFTDPQARPMALGYELFARRRDDSEFRAHIALAPLHTGDGMLVMAAVRDITGWEPEITFSSSDETSATAAVVSIVTQRGDSQETGSEGHGAATIVPDGENSSG
jgi:PAS domain S-box-containing protein